MTAAGYAYALWERKAIAFAKILDYLLQLNR